MKFDETTLVESRGKFVRVCVEVDLTKLLKAGYRSKGRLWKLQYEGLNELCFQCGRYNHRVNNCPTTVVQNQEEVQVDNETG